MHLRRFLSFVFGLTLLFFSETCRADMCEFATVEEAKAFGWDISREKSTLEVTTDSKAGTYALKVAGQDGMGDYGGIRIRFPKNIDLTSVKPEDKISFYIKQNFSAGITININGGGYYRSSPAARNQWSKVELDMDLKSWESKKDRWEEINYITFYNRNFNSAGHELFIDGLTITVGGQEVKQEEILPIAMAKWSFPYETADNWFIGSDKASWAVSKKTGEITGGWNVKTKENYLVSGRGRYYLENRQTSWQAMEEQDVISDAKLNSKNQEITLKCTNPAIPGTEINKSYRLDGTRLRKETVFKSARKDDIFITFNTEVSFDKGYRKDSYYMGAGYVGPLVPAPELAARRRVTEYRNSTKGMILSQPLKQYSFAHYRMKLDGRFVFPWWTSGISGSTEENNVLHYTPNGWEMSLGTSKIAAGGSTSCEEDFQIFGGNWYDFYTREYPSLPEVKQEMSRVPPVPEWAESVIAYTGIEDRKGGLNKIKRILETTDDGYIMVLLCNWGSWADYYVDEGLVGDQGGFITGPELKAFVQKLHDLSPRIKVCIYTWPTSATYEARILAKHPEWFRMRDKEGNPSYQFPGLSPNYSAMFEIEECRREILRQYDLIFRYLNVDVANIDGGKTYNLINWETGGITRDYDCYDFFLEVRKITEKHGSDKMLFLNGRGSPYGDVNFIEARGQLRAGYWRDFAGMGLGIEAFLKGARPEGRIIPLYWTPLLAREYVNRTIALGWIPELTYVDEIDQRPFITAAYEMGRLTTVNMDYSPDWKKDASTNLESYPMRRETGEYLLSLINNEEKAGTFEVKVNLNSLELDKNRNIAVWAYRVENALEFKGQTSEKASRKIYRETGWKMDMVARPELLYLGKYTGELTLKMPLNPLELTVIEITDNSAGLYSVDGLPCNFYLSGQKGIKLTQTASGARIDSEIDEAEVVLFVPDGKEVKSLKLNGRNADYELADAGGRLMPVVMVKKGTGHALEILLGDTAGKTPAGKIRQVKGEKPVVTSATLGVTPLNMGRTQEVRELSSVNKTIKGVKIVQKAIYTGAYPLSSLQPELEAFTASSDIDRLLLEAGTTRKIDANQGPAFAGIEMEGAKKIELRLKHTYMDSFHLRSPKMHIHQYARAKSEFAGFMVDYHTAEGYTHRAALSVGVMNPELNTSNPPYGKQGKPGVKIDLGDIVNETREKVFTLDLTRYAPEGWDGRVWFSVGSDSVASDRRLTVEILNVNEQAKAPALYGSDPGAIRELFLKPKSMTIPKASPSPVIDGVVDEEIWQSAVKIDQFFLVKGESLPKAKTQALLFYDSDYLYVGFTCEETGRSKPITGKGNIWDDDEVEVLIDANADGGKTYRQIIVNAAGSSLELNEAGAFNIGAQAAAYSEEGKRWQVEMAIPFKGLGLEPPKSGDKWKFNLARFRPAGEGFEAELITWSSMEAGFLHFDKMGELIFK